MILDVSSVPRQSYALLLVQCCTIGTGRLSYLLCANLVTKIDEEQANPNLQSRTAYHLQNSHAQQATKPLPYPSLVLVSSTHIIYPPLDYND